MNDANKMLFIGRLGKNPELRYTQKQKPVCYLSVAVNKEAEKKTEWNRVVIWGKQAELANQYLKKGNEVFVQGRKEVKFYDGKDGEMKSYEEVNARLIGFSNL
jgi:single-strand DNA-binding protein